MDRQIVTTILLLRSLVLIAGFLAVLLTGTSPVHAAEPFSLGHKITGKSIRTPDSLEVILQKEAPMLSRKVLGQAVNAMKCAVLSGTAEKARYLGVIDYSLPSSEPRLWAFDIKKGKLLWEELVAHGKNSGDNFATDFSNINGSLQSSLGLFRFGESYTGRNGYSVRLHGLEEGINDRALERAIVMHGAPYVSQKFVKTHGRLGRSWGCPAVRPEVNNDIINTFKEDGFLYIFHPDEKWQKKSAYAGTCS